MSQPSAMDSNAILPHPLVELIIAVAALSGPPTATILHLARILPPTQVPLAYAAILRTANQYTASSGLLDDPFDLVDPTCKQSIGFRPNDNYLGFDRLMSLHKSALFWPIFARMFSHLSRHLHRSSFLDNLARCCAYMGDLGFLQRLLDLGADLLACERVMDAASEAGHVNVLQWFLDSKLVVAGISYSEAVAPLAALNGHVHVLDWWCANGTQVGIGADFFTQADVISHACAKGRPQVLDWLHLHFKSTGDNLVDWTPLTIGWVHAAEYSQVGTLERLKANNIPFPYSGSGLQTWIDHACGKSCIEVLDWWYEHTNRKHYSFKAVDSASENGRLDVLEWWAAKQDLVFKFSPSALRMASIHGHAHVLRWFTSKVPSYHLLMHNPSTVVSQAVSPLIPRDIATLVAFGRIDHLASLGYTLLYLARADEENKELIIQVFEAASLHGHVDLLHQFLPSFKLLADELVCDLSDAVASNHVGTLTWCQQHSAGWMSQGALDDDWPLYATEAVASRADLVLSWMFANGKLDAAKPTLLPLLKDACFLADLHILNVVLAKIMKSCPEELEPLDRNASLLTILASMGHVAGLEWWSSNNLPVAESTAPVDFASKRGKLSVLVWWCTCSDWPFLWSEAAIRWAVEHRHVKVMKWWLQSGLVKDQVLFNLLHEGMGQQ